MEVEKYSNLVDNPHDFLIGIYCVKYTSNNEVCRVADMFNFMNKHCQDATFKVEQAEDIQGTMCSCSGYIKASYFIENYIDMCVDCGNNINPLFYLWQEPYKENSKEYRNVVFQFDVMCREEFEKLKKIKDILKNVW